MERNYQISAVLSTPGDLECRTAFHEAGHAAAIHLRNKQQQLPPIYFEIQIKRPLNGKGEFAAKVIDGNLTQNLPIAMLESFATLSGSQHHSCQLAYEADIINLLAGPLAEAKYIALRDGAGFDLKFASIQNLTNFGGLTDVERVYEYLEYFIAARILREQALQTLWEQAFLFVNHPQNWQGIFSLAQHILLSRQEIICCDEAIMVLDKATLLA